MSDTKIERFVDGLGDIVLASFGVFVLFGQEWLTANGYGTVSDVVAILLVILAGIVVAVDIRDLFR
jgi:hypothetical protein